MASTPPTLRPRRLQAGDCIGLFNPSGAIHERAPYAASHAALQAMGFRTLEAPNARARYGHMAGTPQQRADDIHALVANPDVTALMAITGGSGANRVLPLLDMALIARQRRIIGGYSDLTALIGAIQAQTGLVTFHTPLARSEWNAFSTRSFLEVCTRAEPGTVLAGPDTAAGEAAPDTPHATLRGGRVQGRLLGGNLAVLTSLAGTPYMPNLDGAILFLEDVNEYIYRVDRMLSTLLLGGALQRVAGVVLGGFTGCKPSEGSFGTLTLDEVFDDYFGGLGVPVFRGAQFGHIGRKWTLPVGVLAEMDAEAGTVTLLEAAVE